MKRRYSIDNDNLLRIKSPRMRKPLAANGRFGIDAGNRLIYWLNEPPCWRKVYDLPKKIIFTGSWRLNKNYDLELNLDQRRGQFQDDILVIKGNIISVDKDLLVFEVKSYEKSRLLHIQLLKLSVRWFADQSNRLSFMVKKRPPDILTLEGAWQVDDNQQITYTYEKADLKRKVRVSQNLTFEGFWQVTQANRLTYILKHSTDSKFDFRAQIETPNINPKEGVIKYRLGTGLRKERLARDKIISLYGVWKFSRKLGLDFQMEYGKGEVSKIEFAAMVSPGRKNEMEFALNSKTGEPLGIKVTFTHRFLRALDAQAYLRLKRCLDESVVLVGVQLPF